MSSFSPLFIKLIEQPKPVQQEQIAVSTFMEIRNGKFVGMKKL